MATQLVLLVEAKRELCARIAIALKQEGYCVTCAHTSEHALTLLTESPDARSSYDAVVANLDTGDDSGFAVLAAAMELAWPPAVVLTTAHATMETMTAALRGGAADLLHEPVEPKRLLASLARGLERRAALLARAATLARNADIPAAYLGPNTNAVAPDGRQDARMLRVGPLALDLARRSARWGGRALHLTPIEHALLRFIAAAPGQVHGYQAIVQWTHDLDLSANEAKLLIKSHVRNLRRKIDPGYLLHVRGAGYMLVADPSEGESDSASNILMLRERVAVT